jgi:O-antigen/teichoic acid export membrane protein
MMKQEAKKVLKHPLIYGSSIVVTGGLLANFFNFLYNLFMSRSLSVTDYGTLASIISLITFPTLIVTAVNPVIIRFAGDYFAKNDQMRLKGLYTKFFIFLLIIGILIFIFFLFFLPQIANFFHISNYFILILADIIIFISFLNAINGSFLQAKLAFGFLVVVGLVAAILKLGLGVFSVLLGFSVSGAVLAMVVSGMGGYLISFIPLRFLFYNKITSPEINTKELFRYGIPSALTLLGLISFISSDIILVKHYFDSVQAGQYAGLSLIGRVIFFISAPIGTVMFPILVQKHTKGDNFSNTFKLSMCLMLIPSILITLFYHLFPNFSILFFLKRPAYLSVAPLLSLFGLYITSYNVLYLFANFYLSIKKTKIYFPILIGAVLQIVLITIYHQNFLQIIMISLALVLLLVIGFLIYYPYATKK